MGGLETLPPWFSWALVALLGLCVGSFLNVVVHRLPRGESLLRPGSHCPACQAPLRARDNLPLLSYLCLRGRCAHCGARISPRYPALEVVCAALFVAVALRYGAQPMTLLGWGFGAALLAAAVIDFDYKIIPDEISLGGLGVALVATPLVAIAAGGALGASWLRAASGALLGGGLFWAVGFLHARVSTALGREFPHWPGEGESPPRPGQLDYWLWFPGVGLGDVKLLAMIGAVLGPLGALQTILLASLLGLVLGLAWAAVTRQLAAPFGFGPALAGAAIAVLLWPDLWLL